MTAYLKKVLERELARYAVVGCSAVVTDTLVYFTLIQFLPYAPAKTTSFLSGTAIAYLLNKYWTFKKPERSHTEVAQFMILYTSTLGANVAVNSCVLYFAPTMVTLAFIAATATSTILNYVGQKWWVFKKNS